MKATFPPSSAHSRGICTTLIAFTATAMLAACGSGSAPAASPPMTGVVNAVDYASCLSAEPQQIDKAAAAKQQPPVIMLVLNRGSAGSSNGLLSDADRVLATASSQGATVLLTGGGLADIPVMELKGDGNNPSTRQEDRCTRLQKATAQVHQAIKNPPTPQVDLFGSFKAAFDTIKGLAGSKAVSSAAGTPDTVIVLGTASNTVGINLTGEALDQPKEVLTQLGQLGLVRSCKQTRFAFVVREAAGSDHNGVGTREFWRQYSRSCGGKLVTWSPTFDGVGDTELPPAATPVLAPTPKPSPSRNPNVTPHTFSAQALFPINSATLTPQAKASIRKILLDVSTATRIEVFGYTDSSGDPNSNTQLSQARAVAVAAVLRDQLPAGVPIIVKGRGDADPVAPNTPASRHLNRRVVVDVFHG
jgi:outer membrane protein OmpA-like peptidoglycan-associated protein